MIRVFLINLIIILFLSSKSLIAADMSGYLLSKAIKDFNDNNYESAYKSLSNIVPTGNPVAAYLLGQMYLKGLGIEIDHKAAYEMKNRVDALINGFDVSKINIGTFHSISAIFLRKNI